MDSRNKSSRKVRVTVDDPFRAVFAIHPQPMWIYDPATSAILDVNQAALDRCRVNRDEFLRCRPDELRKSIASQNDGEVTDVELGAHSFDFGGTPAVLVTVRDIGHERDVERALAQAETDQRRMAAEFEERVRQRTVQLQAAVSELEAFSYSVSHDLRAPLRSIAGFSQALIEDAGDSLSADARDDIARIIAAAQRMDHLINDLLTLSMVSRTTMTRDTVDISGLAQKIVSELADVSPTRDVSVSIAPNMIAQGDPRLVRVALENMLTNAWKFTSRREHASIEVGQMPSDGAAPVYFVRDNGVGFDPAFADKLFGPFQRLHDAAEYPGTGIGLATVRRIVLRHGGRIWVEARLAKGACFFFTLQ
jgi:light-regulated signal transduction histidine kinase (bacteriophytochrome)